MTYNKKSLAGSNGLKRKVKKFKRRIRENYYLSLSQFLSSQGSKAWLIGTEIKYGGKTHVRRNKVSPFDPRTKEELARSGEMGGDRMLDHGYANSYSSYLRPFVQQREKRLTICEFGILNGTGLAIWCDLFPNSRCIGFDIDFSNIEKNMDDLLDIGAFSSNRPELHEYDQFVYSVEYLGEILNGDKIDICMDDGNHSDKAIAKTFSSVLPHLNDRFVYFIEDNRRVHKNTSLFEDFAIHAEGELTVITPSPHTPII